MNSKLKKVEIEQIIKKINKRIEKVNGFYGKIPRIEIDLLMESIRNLYERVCELDQLNQSVIEKHTEKGIPDRQTETVETEQEPGKEPSLVTMENPVKEVGDETLEKRREKQIKVKDAGQVISNEEKLMGTAQKKRKIDLIQNQSITLADKFLDPDDKSIAAKIKNNPIIDLKIAIDINDKFLFIKELFKNNIKDYNEAIENLNSINSIEETTKYLEELKEKYKWNDKMEYLIKLREIVERKYLLNRET
ncbi:MAG: hypothetical protein IMY70_01160 [Bacteroidetes bacterium]|nr:hypothetical protein [Bacteroidota bacterium]